MAHIINPVQHSPLPLAGWPPCPSKGAFVPALVDGKPTWIPWNEDKALKGATKAARKAYEKGGQ